MSDAHKVWKDNSNLNVRYGAKQYTQYVVDGAMDELQKSLIYDKGPKYTNEVLYDEEINQTKWTKEDVANETHKIMRDLRDRVEYEGYLKSHTGEDLKSASYEQLISYLKKRKINTSRYEPKRKVGEYVNKTFFGTLIGNKFFGEHVKDYNAADGDAKQNIAEKLSAALYESPSLVMGAMRKSDQSVSKNLIDNILSRNDFSEAYHNSWTHDSPEEGQRTERGQFEEDTSAQILPFLEAQEAQVYALREDKIKVVNSVIERLNKVYGLSLGDGDFESLLNGDETATVNMLLKK